MDSSQVRRARILCVCVGAVLQVSGQWSVFGYLEASGVSVSLVVEQQRLVTLRPWGDPESRTPSSGLKASNTPTPSRLYGSGNPGVDLPVGCAQGLGQI